MTESAAIALLLAELFPEAALAPAPGDPRRSDYMRWLIWLVASVYPTFTFADYPERLAVSEAAPFLNAVKDYRQRLWLMLEEVVGAGGWVLGDRSWALDVYVAVMTRFTPRRTWFGEHCPKLHAIALHIEDQPVVGPVLARIFEN